MSKSICQKASLKSSPTCQQTAMADVAEAAASASKDEADEAKGAAAAKGGAVDAAAARDRTARPTPKLKRLCERAAAKTGLTMADWCRAVLARAANEGAFAPRKEGKDGRKRKE